VPLRLAADPVKKRKANILEQTEKSVQEYINREGRPDFIFHHGVFDYCYLTKFVSQTFDLPVWYMENSPNLSEEKFPCSNPFDTREDQIDFVQNIAKRRFAVTKAYVKKMTKLFGAEYELCPNVVTDDFFIDPADVDKSSRPFQFVNVAILDKRKNQKLILEAFAANYKDDEDYRLVIAGDGILQNDLQIRAEDLGILEQVEILGYQSRERIVELLDQSHCFVLSSHSETFGVVIVEAMGRGLPVISSKIEGPAEIVNKKTGLLFEPDNAAKLAEAMQKVVKNYDRYRADTIVEYATKNYGPDASKKALFPDEQAE
jgi:glycosyltransferase involved in cell wall biosynthesis